MCYFPRSKIVIVINEHKAIYVAYIYKHIAVLKTIQINYNVDVSQSRMNSDLLIGK